MVDTSLYEAGIVHTYWQSAIALATGNAPGPMGSAHPLSAPYQAFATSDGWLVVGGANQSAWKRLLEVLDARRDRGRPALPREQGPHGAPGRARRRPLPALRQEKHGRVADAARAGGRAGGPGPGRQRDARRPADAGARDGGGGAAQPPRPRAHAGPADQAVAHRRAGRGGVPRSMASRRARCWARWATARPRSRISIASGAVRVPEAG